MNVGTLSQPDGEQLKWLEAIIARYPAGILVLQGEQIVLINSPAAMLLGLGTAPVGQLLRIEGPDGALIEHIADSAQREVSLTFRLPDNDRVVQIEAVKSAAHQWIVRVDDYTAPFDVEVQTRRILGQLFHDLKTPVAVLSLGLSNLQSYAERLDAAERQAVLQEMIEQVEEMNQKLAALYQQTRSQIG